MPLVASATPPPPEQVGPQRPRVCVCESDALFRALLGEWLQRAGYELARCEPGVSSKVVVLVVADVPAPRWNGAASIAALRQRYPGARVLAISGQFMPGMHGLNTAALDLGADAVLAKPFAVREFLDAVQALLERA
jgi:DNA-binding response OmpR family regulator